jgi:hypothetical protein
MYFSLYCVVYSISAFLLLDTAPVRCRSAVTAVTRLPPLHAGSTLTASSKRVYRSVSILQEIYHHLSSPDFDLTRTVTVEGFTVGRIRCDIYLFGL